MYRLHLLCVLLNLIKRYVTKEKSPDWHHVMHTWVAVHSLRLTVPHRLLLNLEVRPELTFGWNLQISGSVCENEPLYYNFTSI